MVGGKTYYLERSAFTTLTEAYDAASTGNSIYLSAGIYADALTIAKNIKIYGPNYLISGTSTSRVDEAILTGNIDITSDALLSGISLQENATITLNSNTSNVELQYIYNTSNGSTSGTYISTIFGTINKLVIDQSLFRMNVAEKGAHGIALTEAKAVDLKNSTFENSNYSSNAVAIRIKTIGTSVSITNFFDDIRGNS